jgi:LacI family transcriptional regulator
MVTIKEIAEITGFSINTVSNALCNKSNVKKSTKEYIHKVAKDLNYIPNAIARSLVSKKTFLIALVMHSIGDPFSIELVNYIENFVYSSNYKLILFNHNDNFERQSIILKSIIEQGVDGVLIIPALSDKNIIDKLNSYSIPFVVLARNYDDYQVDFVGVDFKLGLKIVVEHFLKYDRRCILNICGSFITQSSNMRLLGYKYALDIHNIEFNQKLVINNIKSKEHLWDQIDSLIKSGIKVDAIYCYDFFTTSAVLEYCKINSINIPKDIALIGFEFDRFCDNAYVPVTALKLDLYGISENAWIVLKKMIDSNNSTKIVQNIYTKPKLVIRKSCGEVE